MDGRNKVAGGVEFPLDLFLVFIVLKGGKEAMVFDVVSIARIKHEMLSGMLPSFFSQSSFERERGWFSLMRRTMHIKYTFLSEHVKWHTFIYECKYLPLFFCRYQSVERKYLIPPSFIRLCPFMRRTFGK